MGKAGGPPEFVAAHWIATQENTLEFDLAYRLAHLVIVEGGGPTLLRKPWTKKMASELNKLGYLEMAGEVDEYVRDQIFYSIPTATEISEGMGYRPTEMYLRRETLTSGRKYWYVAPSAEGVELIRAALEAAGVEGVRKAPEPEPTAPARVCFSCGQPAQWLITALISEGTRAGRLMVYCTDCRNQRVDMIGVSLDLELIGDRMTEALDYLYGISAISSERALAEEALGLA